MGCAARESGASMMKLMRHPIASFGVPLPVVVRREMEVVVSCGKWREMEEGGGRWGKRPRPRAKANARARARASARLTEREFVHT